MAKHKLENPDISTVLAKDETLIKSWRSFFNILFGGNRDAGLAGFLIQLENEIKEHNDYKHLFNSILLKWINVKPDSNPRKLIEILRSDAFQCNGTAEELKVIDGFNVSMCHFSNIMLEASQEFSDDRLTGHMGKLMRILQRYTEFKDDAVAELVRECVEKTLGNWSEEKNKFVGREYEFNVFHLVKAWGAKTETNPITLDTVLNQLTAGGASLRCAKFEWEMYIKELNDRVKDHDKNCDAIIQWSELLKYKGLRVLDDKGSSLVFEGTRTPTEEEAKVWNIPNPTKRKPTTFAIKVFPLKNEMSENREFIDKMQSYSNFTHPNILTPKRIWTETVTVENEAEYEKSLGLTTHNDLLHPETKSPVDMLCYEMEFCRINLRLFLRFNNTPTFKDRMEIFSQILGALVQIHDAGTEGHGNICPETILLLEQGPGEDITGPKIRITNKTKSRTSKYGNLYVAMEYENEDDADNIEDKRPNDMYVMGMILFELFCPSAQPNLNTVAREAQRGQYPDKFKKQWPIVAELVNILLSRHDDRPTAKVLQKVLDKSFKVVKTDKKQGYYDLSTGMIPTLGSLKDKFDKAKEKEEKALQKLMEQVETEQVQNSKNQDKDSGFSLKSKKPLRKSVKKMETAEAEQCVEAEQSTEDGADIPPTLGPLKDKKIAKAKEKEEKVLQKQIEEVDTEQVSSPKDQEKSTFSFKSINPLRKSVKKIETTEAEQSTDTEHCAEAEQSAGDGADKPPTLSPLKDKKIAKIKEKEEKALEKQIEEVDTEQVQNSKNQDKFTFSLKSMNPLRKSVKKNETAEAEQSAEEGADNTPTLGDLKDKKIAKAKEKEEKALQKQIEEVGTESPKNQEKSTSFFKAINPLRKSVKKNETVEPEQAATETHSGEGSKILAIEMKLAPEPINSVEEAIEQEHTSEESSSKAENVAIFDILLHWKTKSVKPKSKSEEPPIVEESKAPKEEKNAKKKSSFMKTITPGFFKQKSVSKKVAPTEDSNGATLPPEKENLNLEIDHSTDSDEESASHCQQQFNNSEIPALELE